MVPLVTEDTTPTDWLSKLDDYILRPGVNADNGRVTKSSPTALRQHIVCYLDAVCYAVITVLQSVQGVWYLATYPSPATRFTCEHIFIFVATLIIIYWVGVPIAVRGKIMG